ncbi:PQQ-binding-like beta-propeller repeat protein [Streptosporangium sp. NPDC049376]|uniref:outer membrane protein assembly factor BamB family protein n=1 Tax=Streptosporangium sp. NPDC049376 TaxID=3366192 RepID=UPI0037A395B5
MENGGAAVPGGIRSLLWKVKIPEDLSNTVFVGDVLVVTHGDQIEGREADTGRLLWSFGVSDSNGYSPPEERIGATGDYVVAAIPRDGKDKTDEEAPRGDGLLTFNGRTGALLWTLGSGFHGSDTPMPPLVTYLGVGEGNVLIHLPAIGVVRALDVADGRRRWDSPLPSGCLGQTGGADRWVVAMLISCGRETRLRVLSASTGRWLWEQEVFPLGDTLVVVADGVVGLESDNALNVYDADGRQLYEHVAEHACPCSLVATATGVLVVGQDDYRNSLLTAIVDRRSGRVIESEDESVSFMAVQALDGRIYATRRLGELQSSIVVTVDPVTGEQTPVVAFPAPVSLLGMSRYALLFASASTSSLAAYTTVPPSADPGATARGGVGRERWRDACALIPASTLRAEFPEAHYTPVARPGPPELALDTPVGCDLVPGDARHPVITIDIRWAGTDKDETEDVLQDLMARFDEKKPIHLGHGAQMYTNSAVRDVAILRAGDTVVRMDGAGGHEVTVRLARQVVRGLRATR